ncbi:MAG: hypothetical protein EZS28_020255, partial [Streblomastix strix]
EEAEIDLYRHIVRDRDMILLTETMNQEKDQDQEVTQGLKNTRIQEKLRIKAIMDLKPEVEVEECIEEGGMSYETPPLARSARTNVKIFLKAPMGIGPKLAEPNLALAQIVGPIPINALMDAYFILVLVCQLFSILVLTWEKLH